MVVLVKESTENVSNIRRKRNRDMNSIPKKIHYCWFGRAKKPKETVECIESWKKILPDYQIVEWNEENFHIEDSNDYVKEAYAAKKWAFVSDYVRLYALYHEGGVYFDTDVILFKRFDQFLNYDLVFSFESKDYVATSFFAAKPKNEWIFEFMNVYHSIHFKKNSGMLKTDVTNVMILTHLLERKGLTLNGKTQKIGNAIILKQSTFSPNDLINIFGKFRKRSYAYHFAGASWKEKKKSSGFKSRTRRYLIGIARNTIGTDRLAKMSKKIKRSVS